MDIHMDWWDSHQMLPRAYLTDEEHKITVRKESIPIVFVPGIMGSRLKRGKEKVWDPDSRWFMKQYVYASAKTRQQLLGSPGLEVDNETSDIEDTVSKRSMKAAEDADHSYFIATDQYERAKQQGRDAVKQGWGGVAWKYYGGIIQTLAEHGWHPFNKVFDHPVYAVGYNWIQDNALSGNDLAAKIESIRTDEKAKGRICEQVIVVSHSMGGLVSRAAAMLSGAGGKILGVIHGAQPVLGAPAAYKRMRAGFDSDSFVFSHALGASSEDVMPVMTHSVGALELLPNTQYETNHGEVKWLKMTKDGLEIESLPSSDPYASIYEDANSFLRLAYHPEYISPLTNKASANSSSDGNRKALALLGLNLEAAKAFHHRLHLMCHPFTYSSWVGKDGPKTWDRVEYRYIRDHIKPQTVEAYGIPLYTRTTADPSEGTGTDYWESKEQANRRGYYQIQSADGYGDGTVPESSGGALRNESKGIGNQLNIKVISSVEHSEFYNNAEAANFTMGCVYELTQKQFSARLPTGKSKSKGKAPR